MKHRFTSNRKIEFIAAAILCVMALYIFSIGAVAKLDDCGWIGEPENKILRLVYVPLGLLCVIPSSNRFFDWYVFDVWKCDSMTTR
jgi:hypothetical protein